MKMIRCKYIGDSGINYARLGVLNAGDVVELHEKELAYVKRHSETPEFEALPEEEQEQPEPVKKGRKRKILDEETVI